MRVLPQSTEQQTQPTNPGSTARSPASFLQRTGSYLPGAFLLVALISVVSYGASSTNTTEPAKASASEQAESENNVTPLSINEPESQQPTQKDVPMNDKPVNSNVSTSIVNNNGKTTVTVNGEKVATPEDGPVSKTVTTDNGDTVQVNVSQGNSTNTNASSSSFSSSTSSYWSTSSGSINVNSGN